MTVRGEKFFKRVMIVFAIVMLGLFISIFLGCTTGVVTIIKDNEGDVEFLMESAQDHDTKADGELKIPLVP